MGLAKEKAADLTLNVSAEGEGTRNGKDEIREESSVAVEDEIMRGYEVNMLGDESLLTNAL